jgi:hypothetical protein
MADGSKKTVFLLPPATMAIRHLNRAVRAGTGYSWVYLGKSVLAAKRLEHRLGDSFRREFIGDLIQETAQAAREEYIEYTGTLFSLSRSPIWFLSSLSERNPFVSDLLLHYTYLEAGRKLALRPGGGDLVIICENHAVLDSLARVLSDRKDLVSVELIQPDAGRRTARLHGILRGMVRRSWFVLRFASRILCARLFRMIKGDTGSASPSPQRYVIMHSWTDARSFQATGGFVNSYFGEVGLALEGRWADFLYLADVLPSFWYPRAVFRLLGERKNVRLMEEHISMGDLGRALVISTKEYPLPPVIPPFRGVDMTALVTEEIRHDRSDTRVEQALLCASVGRRLCQEVAVGLFLYTFEHHVWEKMFCKAIEKEQPSATLAGYAIVFVNPMYTCYSLPEAERGRAPLPNVIFVSGEQGRAMLTGSGFPEGMIRVGGAIRYPDFLSAPGRRESARGNSVLLALSGELNASLELVLKALDAFAGHPSILVTVKCHPTIPWSTLSGYLPPLPGSFSVSDTPVHELLPGSGLVLYTESTVCVEAAAAGVPLLHVRSEHAVDINIFEKDPAVPSSADPREIRRQAERILGGSFALPSRDTLRQLFFPADTGTIVSAFIDLISGE